MLLPRLLALQSTTCGFMARLTANCRSCLTNHDEGKLFFEKSGRRLVHRRLEPYLLCLDPTESLSWPFLVHLGLFVVLPAYSGRLSMPSDMLEYNHVFIDRLHLFSD